MRKYLRHPIDIPIEYDLEFELDNIVSDRREYLYNLSEGGLSFRANRYITPGSIIIIKIPLVNPAFQVRSEVVWCSKNNGVCFDIGVKFLDENTEFRVRMIEQVCYIEHYKKEIFEREGRKLSGEQAALEWINKFANKFPS
ncbi:MAG: type IV pilus assembly PilZ [uncultured bacterium]|nr:MAG: type IV pilus assembly PilZ [uncultured bacterium]